MVPQIVRFHGPLALEPLRHALLVAQSLHPFLGVRIVDEGDHFTFQSAKIVSKAERLAAVPLMVVKREDERHWEHLAEAELQVDFPGPFAWRCTYLRNERADGDHELVLVFHHSISDGISTTQLVQELFAACGGDAQNETGPVATRQPVLPPVEQMLPVATDEAVTTHEDVLLQIPFHDRAPIHQRKTRLFFRHLHAPDLAAFRRRCKTAGSSVNGGVTAAFLLALHAHNAVGSVPFGNAVSLRDYCQPEELWKIDNLKFGCYVMVVGTVHEMKAQAGFWDLARRCRQDLKGVMADAAKQGFLPRDFDKNEFERMQQEGTQALDQAGLFAMNGAMSNLGVLDFPEKYGPITLKELYFATAQPTPHFAMALYLLTLHGKLFCCFSSCEPLYDPEKASRVADKTMDLMRRACQDSDDPLFSDSVPKEDG